MSFKAYHDEGLLMTVNVEKERLEFGKPIKRNKTVYREEPLAFLREGINNLLRKAIEEDNEQSRKFWRDNKAQKRDAAGRIFGVTEEDPLNASPYSISICVRRFGFEARGIPEAPIEAEALIGMMLGTGGHKELQAKLTRKIFAQPEKSLFDKESGISGRADLFFEHPITKRGVVLDFKFVSSWHYKQVLRDGSMSEAVKLTKGVYTPESSYQLQLDLYMFLLTKMGYEMEGGGVVYINRDSGEWKLALEPWDSEAKARAEELIRRTIQAREIIKAGGSPEDIEPTAQKPSDCKYCPFVYRCREGQQLAGGKSKVQRRRMTPQMRAIASKEIDERKDRLKELGIIQKSFFDIPQNSNGDSNNGEKKGPEEERKHDPFCGEREIKLEKEIPSNGKNKKADQKIQRTDISCDCGGFYFKTSHKDKNGQELHRLICPDCGASHPYSKESKIT